MYVLHCYDRLLANYLNAAGTSTLAAEVIFRIEQVEAIGNEVMNEFQKGFTTRVF
jgi:hypothetical protein